jgi:hypothetical protein
MHFTSSDFALFLDSHAFIASLTRTHSAKESTRNRLEHIH